MGDKEFNQEQNINLSRAMEMESADRAWPAEFQADQPKLSRSYGFFGGLRGALLTAFLLISILTIGLIVAVSIFLSIRASRNLVLEQLASEIELKEQAVHNWLSERTNDLAVIANNPGDIKNVKALLATDDKLLYETFRRRLEAEFGPTSRFNEMFLLNPVGQVVVTTNEENLGKTYANQSFFLNSLSAPFASALFHNIDTGATEIVIAVPIRDESGGLIGVLSGRLNLSELTELILVRTGSTQTGETYLVDRNRRFLTEPRFAPSSQSARSEGIERALTAGPDRNGQDIYNNYNGVEVAGAYRWIPELQVALITERDADEALAGVRQLGWFSGGVAVLTLVIATVIALYFTSRITRPISRLTQVATAVAEGDLTQTADIQVQNEIGVLAESFNTMTGHLRDFIESLEDRVYERTHALETSADISTQLIAIRDLDQLLRYVVNRIQEQFGFYHTHVYLIEAETGDLVMTEGSGEVGRQLKEKGHRLEAGQGIVGTVASTNEAFLSNNVDDLLNFVRNPLLPETKSELAVPLRKGNEVLGVLDIQSEQPNRFSQSDLSLMQAIANQVAIAVDNVRLLEETRVALDKVEQLNRRLTGEAWEQTTEERPATGYRFVKGVSLPVTRENDMWLPPMKQAAMTKQLIKAVHPGNGGPPRAELAVPLLLRGQVIGTLGLKREEAADWSEDELTAVESVANQITLALENARLSEEQAKTIVQLKDVDRLKSEFLTSMSHELRTPLNSIIGFADVILQGIDGDLPDLAMNDVRLIYNSGQHLLALINDILDLAKIEAGKMELVREPINVTQAIKEVLAASRSLLKDKPVEVVVETEEHLPLIYADKLRFNQILLNLVSNAAKFTEKGEIILEARVYDPEPDKMFVSVTDSGIGIPPDKVETIFDRFRQADSSTTRKYGGTGLGLPICKQLVEMHGGHIGVISREGKGSTFYFTIPLVQETVAVEG